MKRMKMKGKTVEEAVSAAAQVLGVPQDQLTYRVVSEGKGGVMGLFGGQEAEVEVREKGDPAKEANEVLQEIINKMGLLAVGEIVDSSPGDVSLNIKGEELGQIIGKQGATLIAAQTIISTIISNLFGERVRVHLDAGGYLERQADALRRVARQAADDVVETGKEKELPPMSASDRRIVHMALKDNEKVTTFSKGEGADRRLIIAPK